MIPIIDTHLHLLYQEVFSYDWCEGHPVLDHDFTIETYQRLIEGLGVAGSIFMEVDARTCQIPREAAFFTNLVKQSDNPLLGVVAACRPESDDFQQVLEATLSPAVRGLRRVLHTMPDALSQSTHFRENVRSLAARKLSFDVCVLQRQLPIAYELIKACPDNQFILDHCGVPTLTEEDFPQWQAELQKMAQLPNVQAKISGIIAYCATPELATLETLHPWIESTVEAFGTDRIVLGSDWPVCNLTQNLPHWINMLRSYFSDYSEAEQHAIFHHNATNTYNIPNL
ncbi:amidohydrolase family protein [Rubritalea marina]|uniref:amidohydrolase family protein n=1 Tax=Rubritalea marina TaxID=361055 RepID=UPI00036650D8|nr:amidohydrolase family protein [Rubritalea marina]